MKRILKKVTGRFNGTPSIVTALSVAFLLVGVAAAGSLTPPGAVGSTMHSLANIWDSIASSSYDSSGISANQNGSLIQHLKYIEANLSSGSGRPASNSLDWDEMANALTLDAATTTAMAGNNFTFTGLGNVGIGTGSPTSKFSIVADNTNANVFLVASSSGTTTYPYVRVASSGHTTIDGQAAAPKFVAETRGPVAGTSLDGAFNVFVQGKFAYVANNVRDSLAVVDISNPASPSFIAETRPGGANGFLNGARAVFVAGRYAYVTTEARNSLAVVDISNPASPSFVAEARGVAGTSLNSAYTPFVSGRYAYVATFGRASLAVVDISNPASPSFVAETRGPTPGTSLGGARGIFISGKYAYVAVSSRASLAVVDISNPASPSFVAETRGPTPGTSLGGATGVSVSGRYAYVSSITRGSLAVVDISNPASPSFIAETLGGGKLGGARNVHISGRYAYVATTSRNSLAVVDISNPASPSFVAETRGPTPGTSLSGAVDVFVSGRYAYVTSGNRDSLAVIDIGGLTTTQVAAGTINTENLGVMGFATFDNGILTKGGLTVGEGLLVNGSFSTSGASASFLGKLGIGLTSQLPARLSVVGSAGNYDPFDVASSSFTSMFRIKKSGNVGIGTTSVDAKFEIQGNNLTTSSIASISGTSLTAGGSIFNLSLPVSSSANNAHGLLLAQDTAGRIIASWSMGGALSIAGAIRSDGALSTCTGVNTPSSGCIDYAESYPTTDVSLQAGELVAVDPVHSSHVIRATIGSQLVGIISTNPAALIDENSFKTGSLVKSSSGTVPIAMSGRVPVRISGPVSAGDRLTLSETPGIAQKATTAGMTIGIALENSSSGTVMTFVNTSYWAPSVVASNQSTSSADEPALFGRIIAYLSDVVLQVRGLIADTITSKYGVTTYDEDTGLPFCIKVKSGQMVSVSGACGSASPTPADTSGVTDNPSPTPEATQESTPMPTPSDTPTPEPTP